MRLLWTFSAGVLFAGLVLLTSAPLLGGTALMAWLSRGPLWTTLAGQSFFAVHMVDGLMAGRSDNIAFRPLSLTLPGEGPPRRVLARLEVTATEFAESAREGRVRLDVWPLAGPEDLRKPPLYTLVVPGRGAGFDADDMLSVDHGGGRRSFYGLADGAWLFDSDTPLATFAADDRKRLVALAVAEDDLPAGAVAVLTYASPGRVIRRLLLAADNPERARFLRGTVPMTRAVARPLDASHRVLEVSLPAGIMRIPFAGDDLDLAAVQLPAGLRLVEVKPWNAGRG